MPNPHLTAITESTTEAELSQARDAAYRAIEASGRNPAGRAINNTRVLRAVSERRRELDLCRLPSHEDKDEPLPEAAQERLASGKY